MESNLKIRKTLILLFKIFFIGLILQFFLQTFITFELGLDGGFWKVIWSWKEIFVVAGAIFVLYIFVKNFNWKNSKGLKSEFENRRYELNLNKIPIIKFVSVFLITFIITLIVSIIIKKVGIGNYILSAKYNLIGFFIFILSFLLSRIFLKVEDMKIIYWYNRLFKIALVGAIAWRAMVWLIPNFLKFFGYNQYNYEGTIGIQPPAAYYTMINHGFVRNQFLFERPINFGFFLIALWPLFYLVVLKGKSKRKMILPWSIVYGLAVFSTLSRAAIGVWIIQTIIILILIYRKNIGKIFWRLIVPLIILIGIGGTYFYKTSGDRVHSNIGHVQLPLEGLKIFAENPIFGWGAGYAGPASHQVCYNNLEDTKCQKIKEINDKYEITTIGFNPENQYIQVLMEYGILGFIGWIIMYVWLHIVGIKAWLDIRKKKLSKEIRQNSRIIIGFSIGLLGLSMEAFVLHSFVDRMIVYPFMAMFGLAYALYWKQSRSK
ncbi:O-antigen ligase family protein [Candidatus Gracilibacteria bacterium]|nr:O-antigen ligase family protein [Candidatus Gracilibacteria bacterium]